MLSAEPNLRVLCLSPYHGGSHAQFLDEWAIRSRYALTVLTFPPRHFKWRMRQASVGMAAKARSLICQGEKFDVLWTTSMLDAAELRGLLPKELRDIPLVLYFHENQAVYPVRKQDERDQHFALINWASALACDQAWFNSAFNRDSMLESLAELLKKMPDEHSLETLESIRARSSIQPLGVLNLGLQEKHVGPLHIAWVGRWEHDKRPDLFFYALSELKARGVRFQLSVLGQSFQTWPPEFDVARQQFSDSLVHFGYQEHRLDYERTLAPVDVVVSTADHEFFGVALLEAVSAGAIPLVPRRLVYPEIYPDACCYDDIEGLVSKLVNLTQEKTSSGTLLTHYASLRLSETYQRYDFDRRAPELDEALRKVAAQHQLEIP